MAAAGGAGEAVTPGRAQARLGVLGWPVAHSRSPAMHNAALRELGLSSWRYQLLPVPPELFAEVVRALPAAGFRGANVTIPHKGAALALAASASERARAIGAANTLVFGEDGAIEADNTDGPALLEALGERAAGATAVVLGAGGSARAAIWALRRAGAARLLVWSRNRRRARELCDLLGGEPAEEGELGGQLLVNCTPVGLEGLEQEPFKALPLTADHLSRYETVIDFVYGDGETRLARAARERGVRVIDGRELLLRQGAIAFERFTGRRAPIEVMRRVLAP